MQLTLHCKYGICLSCLVCCSLLLALYRLVLITSWAVKDTRLAPYAQEDISLKTKFCCLLLASSSLQQTLFAYITKCSCQKRCSSILWFICQNPKISHFISLGQLQVLSIDAMIIKIKHSDNFAGINDNGAFNLYRNRKGSPRISEKNLEIIHFLPL